MTFTYLSFVIPECSADDLGNVTTLPDSRCNEGESSASIENGVVCYESTSPQSVAVYQCDSGYQLEGSMRRECKADGQWSLPEPVCVISSPSGSSRLFNTFQGV